jgi:hypothetical protein
MGASRSTMSSLQSGSKATPSACAAVKISVPHSTSKDEPRELVETLSSMNFQMAHWISTALKSRPAEVHVWSRNSWFRIQLTNTKLAGFSTIPNRFRTGLSYVL